MARGASKATAGKPKPSRSVDVRSGKQAGSHKSKHVSTGCVPLALQQKCLNIFRDALNSGDDDSEILQAVKGHLYNRDFATAFGKEEYLRVYASRWSPSRALAYLEILAGLQDDVVHALAVKDQDHISNVTCIGGGAGAEVVALAGWLSLLQESRQLRVKANCIDIAAWSDVVTDLYTATVSPPELSKYASATAREANVSLLSDSKYDVKFEQQDILAIDAQRAGITFTDTDLVTIMFTLNELYATSMSKTQEMLAILTANLRPGALLLVVDSPGSYSTVSINGAEKKYPMQWLLDYTLIGARDKSKESPTWHKLVVDESRWFRLPPGLQYQIELENMRYQIHVYRRLADPGDE